MLKPWRQLCSPRCSPKQWDSGNTALALPHLPSCSQPGVPAPEPLPRAQLDPSAPINPGTAQRRHLHLGLGFSRLGFPRSQNGLPCLHGYPRSSLSTLPLPSVLQLPQPQASTRQQPWPWHRSPHAPKSSSLQAGEVPPKASSAPPPPQCPWQRHTRDRKHTPGTWSLGNAAQRGDLIPAERTCNATFG